MSGYLVVRRARFGFLLSFSLATASARQRRGLWGNELLMGANGSIAAPQPRRLSSESGCGHRAKCLPKFLSIFMFN